MAAVTAKAHTGWTGAVALPVAETLSAADMAAAASSNPASIAAAPSIGVDWAIAPSPTRAISPRYYGTGNYADGGASYGGGYDDRQGQQRYGSLYRSEEQHLEEQYRAPQQRYRTGPKGYTRSDDRLREEISERLMMADSIDSSDVSVVVKDAKVTLEGSVPNSTHETCDRGSRGSMSRRAGRRQSDSGTAAGVGHQRLHEHFSVEHDFCFGCHTHGRVVGHDVQRQGP